jgi:DNA-binding response OmpR family regulator
MKRKILLIEDNIELNETICDFLQIKYFEVVSLFDGDEVQSIIYENNFDLILLDVKLPNQNGFDIAKQIREFSEIPIIFITSLNSLDDIENGFILGGDDYLTKPFALRELYLRIKAILKRLYNNNQKIFLKDNLCFDVESYTLFDNDKIVNLKQKELKLLDLFIKNKNKILTKEQILDKIYDYDEIVNENSLRTFIVRLRKVLKDNKIKTIKNIGYRFIG